MTGGLPVATVTAEHTVEPQHVGELDRIHADERAAAEAEALAAHKAAKRAAAEKPTARRPSTEEREA
jgi:hypothetical protein